VCVLVPVVVRMPVVVPVVMMAPTDDERDL
jgi:hypothetical protein